MSTVEHQSEQQTTLRTEDGTAPPAGAPRWDEEFDLVCVGSGGAAVAGAATAGLGGARVLVLEKTAMLGGLTAFSEGEIWVPANFVQAREGEDDSREEALEYLTFLSAGLGDAALREHFLDKTHEAIGFFEEHAGLGLSIMPNRVDYFYPDGAGSRGTGRYLEVEPFDARRLGALEDLLILSPYNGSRTTQGDVAAAGASRDETSPATMGAELRAIHDRRTADHQVCGGAGTVARLLHMALSHGAQVRTGATVERLVTEDGRVVGVEVSTPQGTRRIRASGVLLATGGYDWAPDLVRLYEQRTDLHTITTPNQTGDHMVMAGEVGASVAMRPPVFTPLINGMLIPDFPVAGQTFSMPIFGGRPHTIYVNEAGVRFLDETFYPSTHATQTAFDGVTMTYPNLPTWYVFDQSYRDRYALGPFGPGTALPEGLVESADTVAGLAERTGIDAENLAATIERFNGFCERGHDDDFGRGTRAWSMVSIGDASVGEASMLGALDKAPYYAVKLVQLTAGVPSAGLRIDGAARVIGARGTPIEGLYAAGNAAGVVDTFGYQSGTSISRGLTQGYLAGGDVVRSLARTTRPGAEVHA